MVTEKVAGMKSNNKRTENIKVHYQVHLKHNYIHHLSPLILGRVMRGCSQSQLALGERRGYARDRLGFPIINE